MDYVALSVELGITGYIQGKEYRSRCPLHQDNNPSFSLNIETGLWNCFSSCGSGNFIRLIERVLECSPQEAYDWIKNNGKGSSIEQMSKSLSNALGQKTPEQIETKDLYWADSYNNASSKSMPLWFLERGFTWDTVNQWGIKYDPIWDAIIIPIMWNNEFIGTVTRNNRLEPKYKNSQFAKSEVLFGEIKRSSREIIICEGILDALWLWQLGYNAVSSLGVFVSNRQVEIIRSYRFGEIILALDNDEAGEKGIQDAIRKFQDAGYLLPQIKIIRFPGQNKLDPAYRKDPNSCDPEEFAGLYAARKDYINV